MIAVDTAAETTVTTATSSDATAAEVEFVELVFDEMVGNVEELDVLTGIEARTKADRRLNGIAMTTMAFAIVMKLRPYTLKEASRISPTDSGRNIGTPAGATPITSTLSAGRSPPLEPRWSDLPCRRGQELSYTTAWVGLELPVGALRSPGLRSLKGLWVANPTNDPGKGWHQDQSGLLRKYLGRSFRRRNAIGVAVAIGHHHAVALLVPKHLVNVPNDHLNPLPQLPYRQLRPET
jgi:hypothetical protein